MRTSYGEGLVNSQLEKKTSKNLYQFIKEEVIFFCIGGNATD